MRFKGQHRGSGQRSTLGVLEDMLNLTSDARSQKFKILEMKMKARLVKLGGGTDEQRQHELELANKHRKWWCNQRQRLF